MEHSEEYYKMKYFKYKAKYIAELERQKGGAKQSGPTFKEKVVSGASAISSSIAAGASAISSSIVAGVSSVTKYNTNESEVEKAIKELNNIYKDFSNDRQFIDYLQTVTTQTTITELKKELDRIFFNDSNMKKLESYKQPKIEVKNASYKILDKHCTPYIGKQIQQSCINIFQT